MIMTNEEILREHRQARYPMKQIGILADENQCAKREIVEILMKAGEKVPPQFTKNRKPAQPQEGAGDEKNEEEKAMENVKIIPAPEGAGEFQPEFQAELGTGEGFKERVCRGAVDAVAQLLAESDRVRDAAMVDDAAWGFRERVRGVLQLVYQLTVEDEE